ncbi:MAG: Replication-relaxation [Schlesneria sp.]|nr:Replication-relaxation [Schlesneria sp.]
MTEPLKNGQVDPQLRRRPGVAVASPRSTAAGAFPRGSEDSGSAGAVPPGFAGLTQSTHRSRPSGRRRTATGETATWNSSDGSSNGTGNDSTAPTSRGEKTRLRTGWELPELIRPLPVRERRCARTPRLQHHQPAIVEYVYLSRFATASQVQRRFPNWLRTARTTQWQLANLVQLGFLATTPVRSTSPNFPFVYFATGRGVRLINDTYAAHNLDTTYPVGEGRKASGVAVDSILHELLLTELELAVRLTVESRDDLKLLATERRYYRRDRQLRFYQAGRTRRVIPDAGFMIRVGKADLATSQNNSLATMLNFVELDNGTMPPGRVLEKLQQYAAWAESESGQKYLQLTYSRHSVPVPQSGFRLLIVVHDKQRPDGDESRLAALFQQALELSPAMRDRLWFATATDLKEQQFYSPPLAGEIWYRARDAKSWQQEYRRLPEQKANGIRRRFVAGQLRSLPHHPLFPKETALTEVSL